MTTDPVAAPANVLVVDDSLTVRGAIRIYLEPEGYCVREAADGEAGIAACLADPPDVVLLDVEMPGMSGHEVLERLKAEVALRDIPVVFLTGLEDGLFPLAKAYDDPPLLEEERRLFYVGITRAEKKLYLTHAEERRRNGELMPGRQSSFLDEVPDAMVEKRQTVKVRSTGRAMMRFGGDSGGAGGYRSGIGSAGFGRGHRPAQDLEEFFTSRPSAASRRPGAPVQTYSTPSFAPEHESVRPRFAYIPFGGGPRGCIGNQFAMLEAQLIVATIAQRYRIDLLPDQAIRPEPLITLRPTPGIRATISKRTCQVFSSRLDY